MTKATAIKALKKLGACKDAISWIRATKGTPAQLWEKADPCWKGWLGCNDYNTTERFLTAIAKDDQALLADIAKTDKDTNMRWRATRYITDQALLADLAENSEDVSVVWRVVSHLNNQVLLADLAENAKEADIRWKAISRLTDKTALASLARSDDPDIRWRAAHQLEWLPK
jgi:hypothetical protein